MRYSKGQYLKRMFYAISYNHDLYTLQAGINEILDQLTQHKDVFRPDVWKDLDDVWSIIVFLYGDYGTSPRSGWIKYNKYDCIFYYDLLVVSDELVKMMEDNEDE